MFTPCLVTPPHGIGKTRITNVADVMMCDAWTRTWWLLPCSVFGHSLWRNPATMLWGRSSSPVEKSTWWGTEASCQRPAPPHHLCQLVAPLGSRAQPSEAWRWLQCCQCRGYSLMTNLKSELSNQATPGPPKLCEITNVCCWLRKKNKETSAESKVTEIYSYAFYQELCSFGSYIWV